MKKRALLGVIVSLCLSVACSNGSNTSNNAPSSENHHQDSPQNPRARLVGEFTLISVRDQTDQSIHDQHTLALKIENENKGKIIDISSDSSVDEFEISLDASGSIQFVNDGTHQRHIETPVTVELSEDGNTVTLTGIANASIGIARDRHIVDQFIFTRDVVSP